MDPGPLLAIYCLLILLASLLGGFVPMWVRLTHQRMQLAVSFVAGLMLGVGLLHLLPHAIIELGPEGKIDYVIWSVLTGFLVMFFIERFFCFHHHDVSGEEDGHDHGCTHQHHDVKWSGAAVGLSVHSVIAGIALATSVAAESHAGHASGGEAGSFAASLAGFGTFLVIFLHKPFDALTLGTLMARGGWPSLWRHAVNGVFALAIPLGVGLFYLGISNINADTGHLVLAIMLGFSAGTFLCISMSDLLPELQFHDHDRLKLSAALLAGLGVAWVVGVFESQGHEHRHSPDEQLHGTESGKHDRGGHDH